MTSSRPPTLLLTIISAILLSEVNTLSVLNISDPCYNYNVLDNAWRSTNASRAAFQTCDQSVTWTGWYRLMLQGQDVQMPDSCVDQNLCSTDAPLWLNGSHPQLQDGVVTRQVCGHWNSDCCHFRSNPIRVKACPGIYYVYEFVRPSACWTVYCADVNTVKPAVNFPPPIKRRATLHLRLSSLRDITQSPELLLSQFKLALERIGLPRNLTIHLDSISLQKRLLVSKGPGHC